MVDFHQPPAGEVSTMGKHQRKHTKQAYKAVKDVPVIVKRSLAELRRIAEEEEQARWEELQLAHQLSKWL